MNNQNTKFFSTRLLFSRLHFQYWRISMSSPRLMLYKVNYDLTHLLGHGRKPRGNVRTAIKRQQRTLNIASIGQSINHQPNNQSINQSTIQYNTIQTLSTLPEEGFSVTMIIRRNKSKSKNYKITIIMKCFIKNIKKAKMLINIHQN